MQHMITMILNLSFMCTHVSTTDMTLRETQYPHLGTPVIDCSAVTSYISGKENIINKDLGHIPRNFSSSKFSSETCEDESANDVVQTVVTRLKARDLEGEKIDVLN